MVLTVSMGKFSLIEMPLYLSMLMRNTTKSTIFITGHCDSVHYNCTLSQNKDIYFQICLFKTICAAKMDLETRNFEGNQIYFDNEFKYHRLLILSRNDRTDLTFDIQGHSKIHIFNVFNQNPGERMFTVSLRCHHLGNGRSVSGDHKSSENNDFTLRGGRGRSTITSTTTIQQLIRFLLNNWLISAFYYNVTEAFF